MSLCNCAPLFASNCQVLQSSLPYMLSFCSRLFERLKADMRCAQVLPQAGHIPPVSKCYIYTKNDADSKANLQASQRSPLFDNWPSQSVSPPLVNEGSLVAIQMQQFPTKTRTHWPADSLRPPLYWQQQLHGSAIRLRACAADLTQAALSQIRLL